jgi:hypothetical protein
MNQPEYIFVDEFKAIVLAVKTALNLNFLNYQYGYVREFNETMESWGKSSVDHVKKFPCVYLLQPFTYERGIVGFYGRFNNIRLFIITSEANKTKKAEERMTTNFKPVIYPIYRELLNQIDLSIAFSTQGVQRIKHNVTDRYYWGDSQQQFLNDAVDCMEINGMQLDMYDNQNCTPGAGII